MSSVRSSGLPDDFWAVPPLDSEDQRLVDAYVHVGKPLDQIVYTSDFDRLVKMLNLPDTADQKHLVYRRLLQLRKRGRLPQLGRSSLETY